MQSPSVVARRFYHLFFHWNSLCSPHRPPHAWASPACRSYHPSPTLRRDPPHRRLKSKVRQRTAPPPPPPPPAPSPRHDFPASWLTSEPTTSAVRPLDTLAPWEEVVRYRSSAGIMIQTAIPASSVDSLTSFYGPALSKLNQESGARIELGPSAITHTAQGAPERAVGVLYSGTFEECAHVRAALRKGASPLGGTEHGREGAGPLVRYLGQRPRPGSTATSSTLPADHRGTWHSQTPRSLEQLPRARLRPFAFTLRRASAHNDEFTVEVTIPLKTWDRMVALMPVSQIRAYSGAQLVLSDRHFAELLNQRQQWSRIWCRSTDIIGTRGQIDKVEGLFHGLYDRLREEKLPVPSYGEMANSRLASTPSAAWSERPGSQHGDEDRKIRYNDLTESFQPPKPSAIPEWAKSPVVLSSTHLSSSLYPDTYTIRARTIDYSQLTVEIVFPREYWDELTALESVEKLRRTSGGATLQVADAFSAPGDTSRMTSGSTRANSELSWWRPIIFSGSFQQVSRMKDALDQVKEWLKERKRSKMSQSQPEVLMSARSNVQKKSPAASSTSSHADSGLAHIRLPISNDTKKKSPRNEGLDEQERSAAPGYSGKDERSVSPSKTSLTPESLDEAAESSSGGGAVEIRPAAQSDRSLPLHFFSTLAIPQVAVAYVCARLSTMWQKTRCIARFPEELPVGQAFYPLTLWSASNDQIPKGKKRMEGILKDYSKKSSKPEIQGLVIIEEGVSREKLDLVRSKATLSDAKTHKDRVPLQPPADADTAGINYENTAPNSEQPQADSERYRFHHYALLSIAGRVGYVIARHNRVFPAKSGILRNLSYYKGLSPDKGQNDHVVVASISREMVSTAIERIQSIVARVAQYDGTEDPVVKVLQRGESAENLWREPRMRSGGRADDGSQNSRRVGQSDDSEVERLPLDEVATDSIQKQESDQGQQASGSEKQTFNSETVLDRESPARSAVSDKAASTLRMSQQNELPDLMFEITASPRARSKVGGKRIAQRAYSTAAFPRAPSNSIMRRSLNSQGQRWASTEPTSDESLTDPDQLAENLKSTLRTLTHPVVLVTSIIAGESSGRTSMLERFRGVTVSSFNTVTLNPKPIVSFNLRVPSRSWEALRSSERMAIHIPAAGAEGAAIAHAFTQPYQDPSEPFRRLQSLGVDISVPFSRDSSQRRPPRLAWDGAMLARIEAKLLTEESVELGDHMVVFAEVTDVVFPGPAGNEADEAIDDSEALAYAARGYRGVGPSIDPIKLPHLESDAHSGSPETVAKEIVDNEADVPDEVPSTAGQVATDPAKGLGAEQAACGNKVETEHDIDAEILEPENSKPLNQNVAEGEEDEQRDIVERYFESSEAVDEGDPPISSTRASNTSTSAAAPSRPGAPKRGPSHPWGIDPSSKRTFSTIASSHRRLYASSTPAETPSKTTSTKRSGGVSIEQQVSDPAILSTSVADFLGDWDGLAARPRMRGLVRAQNEAQQASSQLEAALADGSLTPEQSARLENDVVRNERHIAKTLALHSARDLQRMLDRGQVDFRRAQWMESSIEKGQAVLLEEAKQVRNMLDLKQISMEQFQTVKEKLEEENQLLSTEAMRLRQFVDEEGEGENAPQQEKRAGFDGFKGNV